MALNSRTRILYLSKIYNGNNELSGRAVSLWRVLIKDLTVLTTCMRHCLILVCGGRVSYSRLPILQIESQKRNAFTLSFLSRRDLQILLVEPAKKTKSAKFGGPTHMGNNRRILLTRTKQSFMRTGWFCSAFRCLKMAPRL